jgi:hypothetical protein
MFDGSKKIFLPPSAGLVSFDEKSKLAITLFQWAV